MNKQRRAELEKAKDFLVEAKGFLDDAAEIIRFESEGEQEGYDNLSQGLQAAERGERMQEVAGELSSIADDLEGLDIDDMIGKIESAIE